MDPNFWNDSKAAEHYMRELRSVKQWILDYEKAAQFVEELEVLHEFHKAGEVDEAELQSHWDVTTAHFEDLGSLKTCSLTKGMD